MANKSLTDLTARTATADSDLLHINSGGTDYKELKSDFTKNLAKWVDFGNSSALTAQIDALAGDCAYEGIILSYGHLSETGVPINANFYVDVIKIASGAGRVKIYALNSSAKPVSYINFKSGGSWQGWVQDPTRDEITSLNNSLANKQDNISVAMIYYGSVNANSSYSITGSANQVYFIVFGTWNFRKICFADPQNGGTPRVTDIGASSNLLTITANGDWGLTFNNGTIYSMPLIIRRLN